jgi:excisionase family DNA binding protein
MGLWSSHLYQAQPMSRAISSDNQNADSAAASEVLTLAEAAQYLRISEGSVIDLTIKQQLPGRKIGDEWRFLRSGLADWLLAPPATRRLLGHAGAIPDDPNADAMLEEIYQRRGRPMTDEST